jgi:hypothetical protein
VPVLKLYPNPAESQVTLTLEHIQSGNVEISFTNLYGKPIKKINDRATGESFQANIPLGDVPQGISLINLKLNGKTYQAKLVKQ